MLSGDVGKGQALINTGIHWADHVCCICARPSTLHIGFTCSDHVSHLSCWQGLCSNKAYTHDTSCAESLHLAIYQTSTKATHVAKLCFECLSPQLRFTKSTAFLPTSPYSLPVDAHLSVADHKPVPASVRRGNQNWLLGNGAYIRCSFTDATKEKMGTCCSLFSQCRSARQQQWWLMTGKETLRRQSATSA